MPSEFRRLTFTASELRSAIADSGAAAEVGDGDVTAVSPRRRDGGFYFDLEITRFPRGARTTVSLAEDELLESMIAWCIGTHVPLPRRSRKEVRTVNDSVCLDIHYGSASAGQPH